MIGRRMADQAEYLFEFPGLRLSPPKSNNSFETYQSSFLYVLNGYSTLREGIRALCG